MAFDELLAVLFSWVGRAVSVGVATGGDMPVMVATLRGRLREHVELDASGEDAAVYFHFEDAGTGFVVAAQHFAGAGWHESDPERTLVVRLGSVSLWLELEPES